MTVESNYSIAIAQVSWTFSWDYRVIKRCMVSRIKGLKRAEIRDHSPGIWDHNGLDRDQQCFSWNQGSGWQQKRVQGSKFSSSLGSGINILGKNTRSVSNQKIYLVTTRLALLSYLLTSRKRYKIMKAQVIHTVTIHLIFILLEHVIKLQKMQQAIHSLLDWYGSSRGIC